MDVILLIKLQDFYGFIFEDHLSTLEFYMHCDCFKNFKDLIFVDDKLLVKTVKITRKNLKDQFSKNSKIVNYFRK